MKRHDYHVLVPLRVQGKGSLLPGERIKLNERQAKYLLLAGKISRGGHLPKGRKKLKLVTHDLKEK